MAAAVSCGIYLRAIIALAIVIAVQAQDNCSDNSRSCRANAHQCGTSSYVRRNCRRTCGICPTSQDNCSDNSLNCAANSHQCSTSSYVRRNCRRTCGICPTSQDPTPLIDISPPTTNFECGERGFETVFSRGKRAVLLGDIIPTPVQAGYETLPLGVANPDRISLRNTWPWMALLGQDKAGRRSWFCSGVLLNHLWVLTAAHCPNTLNATVVRLGEHDYNVNGDGAQILDLGVAEVIYHRSYKLRENYHDIALIKLERPINIRAGVGPVCLPWGNEADQSLEGSTVTITGWGATQFGGEGSSVLNEAEVTVFPTEFCKNSYSTSTDFISRYPQSLGEESLCISDHLDKDSDSCQGDSGGPAVLLRNGRYTLVGIISYGEGCGKKAYPGIYVRVQYPEHLAWIKKVAFSN